jgi:GDP-4-dehydro-6-deoxy-D-mannose reductase
MNGARLAPRSNGLAILMRAPPISPGGVLVTGAGGFIGRRVVAMLAARDPGRPLVTVGRAKPSGIEATHGVFRAVDLTQAHAVAELVAETRPGLVIHLAAQSSVQQGFSAPQGMWRSNLGATIHLAEALAAHAPEATLVFASSSECYGESFASGLPLSEDAPLRPMNAYARSKAAAEFALRDLHARGRLVILRMFNQIGPGQDERFVSSTFAAQIARIEAGLQAPTMEVGDLTAERDFCDASDMIAAVEAILEALDSLDRVSVFNICAGRTRSVQDLLGTLLGLAQVPVEVRVDPERLRPSSIPRAAGSHAALTQATGWCPRVAFEDTLASLLDYWREHVRAS